MSDELLYRGYVIHAVPYNLQTGGWSHEGYLAEHRGEATREIRFFADGISDTREKAVEAVIVEGQRLVDFRSQPSGLPAELAVPRPGSANRT